MSARLELAVLLGALFGTGCVVGAESRPTTAESVDQPAEPTSEGSAQQLLQPGPGAPAEDAPASDAARPGQRWVRGYWHWTGVDYEWIPGHWEPVPSPSGGT
jgi:hypothetical protein